MTLRSTGSAVSKGLDPPLLEEAEVLGGGVTAIGLLLFAPLRYPEMLAEADGDFLIASFLFWIMSSCFWRRSLAFSKCFLRSSFDQYLPICKKWMKFYYMSKKSWRTATYELMMKKIGPRVLYPILTNSYVLQISVFSIQSYPFYDACRYKESYIWYW